MSVDPDNRLVASTLEAEWNDKLRIHSDAAAEHDRRAQERGPEQMVRKGGKICQTVPGRVVDAAIGALLVELVTPMNLAVTLAVQRARKEEPAQQSRC